VKQTKYIVDTTMRDGEQSPGMAMTKEQKVKIAGVLDDAGVYQIEAGIPAVSSYEIDTISEIMDSRRHAKISVWNRLRLEDIRDSVRCRPDIMHISTPVSYVLIYSKLNTNKNWVLKNLCTCVDYALSRGFEVTIGFEDASRADITFMVSLAQQLKKMGVSRIRFADTVGVLSPSRTYQSMKEIISYSGMDVEIHTHNDLGLAVANAVLGAAGGADYIDTTILGLGERAGNCDFSKFVYAAQNVFELGISASAAIKPEKAVAEIMRVQLEK
jgi:homocitrate synthase NifV